MCGKLGKSFNPQIRNVRVVCSIHIIGSKQNKALPSKDGRAFLSGNTICSLEWRKAGVLNLH